MLDAIAWGYDGKRRVRTDVVTFAVALALHAGVLIAYRGPYESQVPGPTLIAAPELEMAAIEEQEEVTGPALEPEEPPPFAGPDLQSESPEAPTPEVHAEKTKPEAAPAASETHAEEPEAQVAAEPVLTDPSDDGAAFEFRENEESRSGAAVGVIREAKGEVVASKKRRATRGRPRPPRYPPGLTALVRRNYPLYARSEGVEGEVVAHVKLSASGRVLHVKVVDVSDDGWGFGEACARTINQMPQWTPMYDELGRPVATTTSFPCRFSP